MIRQNFKLINEIIYRVKSDINLVPDINLELLLKTLESDVIFYLPNPVIFIEFIKKFCYLTVQKYKKIDKIYIFVEDNTSKKSEIYKSCFPNIIEIIDEKVIFDVENNAVIIFDDIKNIGSFNELVVNNKEMLSQFILGFGFTTSPFLFYDLFTSTGLDFVTYAPTIFGQENKWYYKKALEETEIKKYKTLEEEIYLDDSKKEINENLKNIGQFICKLNDGNIPEEKDIAKRLIFLLNNGLYKTDFVISMLLKSDNFFETRKNLQMLNFTSNKLLILFDCVINTSYKNIEICFNLSEVLDIVFNIFKFETTNIENLIPNLTENVEIYSTEYLIKIKYKDKKEKTLHFTTFKNLLYKKDTNLIICYDFKPLHVQCKKIVIYPSNKEDLFLNLLAFENKIETEIRQNYNPPELFGLDKKNNTKFYNLKIFTDQHFEKKDFNINTTLHANSFDPKKKLLTIEKVHNFSYVGFKLNEKINEPIKLDFIKPNYDNICISAISVNFGTIATRKCFLNSYELKCQTFVFFKRDVILLYCIDKDFLYKIKISNSCFEENFFVEKNEFFLNFYLCLSRQPKIFRTQNTPSFVKKGNNILNMKCSERYNLLENNLWNRCSIIEVPFIKNRSDIKLSFDLKNNTDIFIIKEIIFKNRNRSLENKNDNQLTIADIEKKKTKLFDVIDCLISFFARFQNASIIFSNFTNQRKDFLGFEEIFEILKTFSFKDFYHYMCLFSQKSRYLIYNVTKEDIDYFNTVSSSNIVTYLLFAINSRFNDVSRIIKSFKDTNKNKKERKIRQVIVTPLEIIYKMPVVFESNRILREFDYEKFLRVSLREEDFKTKIKDTTIKDQNQIYDYYRNILNEGIFLGTRKYFFVAMTTSQMKLHNAWFLTPYFSNNILIGSDYIRNWLGDFSSIKNIGKYAMRLGQALSSTIPTIDVEEFLEIEDNIKNGFNFTDGVGIISLVYAKIISHKLGLEEVPSAFQIRFGGYKGVIVAHPINEEDLNLYKDFNVKKDFIEVVCKLLNSGNSDNFKRFKFVDFNQQNILMKSLSENDIKTVLILRNSMKKFESKHNNIECITHSSTNPCYLNKQIINLLEGLGIDISVFLEHQDNFLLNILEELNKNPIKYIRKIYGGIPLNENFKDTKIFKKLLLQISNKVIRDLYKKNKILINHGSVLMGVVDELMILKENEVFIKVKKDLVGFYDNFVIDGDYCIVIGPCIIAKNPCLHPGDIRKVIGVNRPELGFLRSVLVFNQSGSRPISNMCSGSDLDGDMYTVIWEKNLIPLNFYEPSSYEDQTFLSKEIVCLKDIVNFYIRYIRNYHLGSIAHAHMVYCDLNDVKSENAKLLAELFNKSIDFPRTGFIASVPESLIPTSYPDFLQIGVNVYQSIKTLGILYRRSFSSLLNTNLKCECNNCLKRFIDGMKTKYKLIFQGSSIKYKYINYDSITRHREIENDFFVKFKKDLNFLLKKYNFKKEDDILLQFSTENEERNYENILSESHSFYKRIRNELKKSKTNEIDLLIISEDCTENINSLPISFIDHKYSFKYKNLYEEDKNGFIYNSNIFINKVNLQIENDVIIDKEIFNEILKKDKIHVFTDIKIYKKFINDINRNCDEIFQEIFNLLFLIDFFDSLSFDLVLVFFLFLQSKIKSHNKMDIVRGLFKISREFYKNPNDKTLYYFIYKFVNKPKGNLYLINIKNDIDIKNLYTENTPVIRLAIDTIGRTIFNVGYFLIFEISLVQKYLSLKNVIFESIQKTQPELNFIKKTGIGDLVIKGMFDTSDELKLEDYKGVKHILHKNVNVYTPKLMNKGFCDIETHKINVREFFIKSYFNCLFSRIQKSTNNFEINYVNYLITITLSPGKFYIYDVPNNFINQVMTLESLISSLQFYKKSLSDEEKTSLKSYFFNNNDLIDEETRMDYIKKKNIIFKEKKVVYIFSLVFNNVRYQIYYEKKKNNLEIKYITKGRCVGGKLFVINETDLLDKDTSFEIMYEEIIKNENFNNLTKEETEIFNENLFSFKDKILTVSKTLQNCKNFRFEIDSKLQIIGKNNLELINRKIYTGNRDIFTLENRHERLVVCSVTTNEGEDVGDVTKFMNIFEKSWDNFIKFYA